MSESTLEDLRDAIDQDRDAVRADLLECLPEAGKVDRRRLRRVLAADREELFRSEGARNSAEFLAAVFHISKWKSPAVDLSRLRA